MKNPIDSRIADTNRAVHALEQRTARQQPQPAPLPDESTVRDRFADNGDDTGRPARTKVADEAAATVVALNKLRKNPLYNAAQIELEALKLVDAKVEGWRKKCEDEAYCIDTAEREVERGIEDALGAQRPEWHSLATEFRTVMSDMTAEQRWDFVKRMETTRYAPLLRFAIASVPPELSGVSLTQHKEATDFLLAVKDPTLLTRPADLRKRRAALAKMIDGIDRTVAELVDREKAGALKELTK